jgi:RimJ/RimL family protein N-acetyltransferase
MSIEKIEIEIVPAEEKDGEALTAIQKKAFKRLYDIYHDEGSPYLRGTEEFTQWLNRPNFYVYKIFADDILCGGIAFGERRESEFYLTRIYILPEMQGKGIASSAITLCEAEFPHIKRWYLDFPVNENANRRCYEKAGYTDTGERRQQSGGAIKLALYEKIIR